MTARDLALLELDRRRLPNWPPEPLLRPRAQRLDDPRDAALADQLLFGVIQNLLLLQHLVAHYSGRSLKSIDPLVQKILAVGLYQLRFLERIPPSAAVNEAVNQTKKFGRTKASGFVNAVLRKATRELPPALPDRQTDPAGYAERALSHPRELFDRLANLMGTEDALAFCERDNREPPLIVRAAAGVSETDLESPGLIVRPHESPGMFIVEGAKRAHLTDWSKRGLAQAQDPTAAAVVAEACPIELGQRVLDRCAGLGTKTLQLWEKAGPEGHVVAIDPNAERCRQLRQLLAERDIANVTVYETGMMVRVPESAEASFDLALLDVPCSNSGVLPRRPEARYVQTADALRSLEKLQQDILNDTAAHVLAGGFLVYSTCSIWPEENQRQVQTFLAAHSEFRLIEEKSTPPYLGQDVTCYRDGGYRARLRRA